MNLNNLLDPHEVTVACDNYKKPYAYELIDYYEGMLDWIETTVPAYRSDMKGLPWGVICIEHNSRKTAISQIVNCASSVRRNIFFVPLMPIIR